MLINTKCGVDMCLSTAIELTKSMINGLPVNFIMQCIFCRKNISVMLPAICNLFLCLLLVFDIL